MTLIMLQIVVMVPKGLLLIIIVLGMTVANANEHLETNIAAAGDYDAQVSHVWCYRNICILLL